MITSVREKLINLNTLFSSRRKAVTDLALSETPLKKHRAVCVTEEVKNLEKDVFSFAWRHENFLKWAMGGTFFSSFLLGLFSLVWPWLIGFSISFLVLFFILLTRTLLSYYFHYRKTERDEVSKKDIQNHLTVLPSGQVFFAEKNIGQVLDNSRNNWMDAFRAEILLGDKKTEILGRNQEDIFKNIVYALASSINKGRMLNPINSAGHKKSLNFKRFYKKAKTFYYSLNCHWIPTDSLMLSGNPIGIIEGKRGKWRGTFEVETASGKQLFTVSAATQKSLFCRTSLALALYKKEEEGCFGE